MSDKTELDQALLDLRQRLLNMSATVSKVEPDVENVHFWLQQVDTLRSRLQTESNNLIQSEMNRVTQKVEGVTTCRIEGGKSCQV